MSDHVRVAVTGAAARITLDRQGALNALTHEMVGALHDALDLALGLPDVQVVLLEGAGERAFCAGGDIVALRASALAGDTAAVDFWRDEYALNARLAGLAKPVVVLMHGVVMGGGIGLGGHASHRLVTDGLVMAMPEVGIGFTPDVGGTWLLSRAPGELGTHLALTGGRIGAADALHVGLADHLVPLDAREALHDDLAAGTPPDDAITRVALPRPDAPLAAARPWVDAAYAGDDAAAIARALAARPEPVAQQTAEVLRTKSPTSVAVTLAALRRAATLPSLQVCLEHELGVSAALLSQPDFAEGIRAQVVDKDRDPQWAPARLEDVDPATVASLLAAPTP